jgi:hypothetical protein
MKNSRLHPLNKYNARLLYISEPHECDICDENINENAVIYTAGEKPTTISICKKCIEEIYNQFNK